MLLVSKTRHARGGWCACGPVVPLEHAAPSVAMAMGDGLVTDLPSPDRRGERTNDDPSENAPNPSYASGVGHVHRGACHVALYQALDRAFGGLGAIPVRFDRRRAERRRAIQSVPEERRRGDRRSFPRIEDDLRWRCVLVRPHD